MSDAIEVRPAEGPDLRERLKGLSPGTVVAFHPGVYRLGLWLEQSITLRGIGGGEVVLEGDGGPIVELANNQQADVTIEGLVLRAGGGGRKPALLIGTARHVSVKECSFEGGDGEIGAVLVRAAEATIERCRFIGNTGRIAQALLAYNAGRAKLVDCLVAGNRGPGAAIVGQGSALVVLDHCTVLTTGSPAVRVIGTGVDAPIFQARTSILGDPPIDVVKGGAPIPNVTLKDCALSRPLPEGADDLGANVVGELELAAGFRGVAGSGTVGRGVRTS